MSDHLYEGSSSAFATARRGGLTAEQRREIEAHRAKDRPTPWQALAERYGVCVLDIKAVFDVKPQASVKPAVNDDEPAPLTWEDYRRAERMSRRPSFWDKDKDQMLRRMWVNQHLPCRVCAEVLGVNIKVVERRLHYLGITRLDRVKAA